MKIYLVFLVFVLAGCNVSASQSLLPEVDRAMQKLTSQKNRIIQQYANQALSDEGFVQLYLEVENINSRMFQVLETASSDLSETLLDPNTPRAALQSLSAESKRINDIIYMMHKEKVEQAQTDSDDDSEPMTN